MVFIEIKGEGQAVLSTWPFLLDECGDVIEDPQTFCVDAILFGVAQDLGFQFFSADGAKGEFYPNMLNGAVFVGDGAMAVADIPLWATEVTDKAQAVDVETFLSPLDDAVFAVVVVGVALREGVGFKDAVVACLGGHVHGGVPH